jgi:hypothetical protein
LLLRTSSLLVLHMIIIVGTALDDCCKTSIGRGYWHWQVLRDCWPACCSGFFTPSRIYNTTAASLQLTSQLLYVCCTAAERLMSTVAAAGTTASAANSTGLQQKMRAWE